MLDINRFWVAGQVGFSFWVAIENGKGNLKLNWAFPLSMRKFVDFLSPTE